MKGCAGPVIEPAKLPNIRLDMLQKTGLLNINGLHQLGQAHLGLPV